MLLRLMNVLAGWFGYEWVRDPRPFQKRTDAFRDTAEEEGWDDLYEHTPRYVLRKKRR
jgi:hypothetical protein